MRKEDEDTAGASASDAPATNASKTNSSKTDSSKTSSSTAHSSATSAPATIANAAAVEAELFDALCELEGEALKDRLCSIEREDAGLASRLRRLLSIDAEYAEHTARMIAGDDLPLSSPTQRIGEGDRIGAFTLMRKIGRGGMGVVYLAERRSDFAQRVAIKIMPRFAIDARSRERFAQERRLLAQLRHPNICSIVDGGELDDGTPWLAMEYVPGEGLVSWCMHHDTPLRERIELFLQLCDAVQYAHQRLVIHRDLKDSNVLVETRSDGLATVKLLDFGIAKSLQGDDGDNRTAAQDRFFSPMTAAPEQIRGEQATVAVDVYALGALLHQLLCGTLPFALPRRDPSELQRAILEIVPPKMSETLMRSTRAAATAQAKTGAERLASELLTSGALSKDRLSTSPHSTSNPVSDTASSSAPLSNASSSHAASPAKASSAAISADALRGELDAIVAHCLRKAPEERYPDVGALARDLRAWLSGHPISISNDDRTYRLRKFVSRNRLPVALTSVAVFSVLAALGISLWQASALRVQRDAAEAARQRSEIDRDRARAVADFMRETFEQADPGRASESGLLARELIARGKQRLDRLDGQQNVQAELSLLLAESDAALGLNQDSEALYRQYASSIQTLSAIDPKVRLRARLLKLSNDIVLHPDGPQLDRELAQLQRLADTPQLQVELTYLRQQLYGRRSKFALAAQTLEDAWRLYAPALGDDARLRLQIGLAEALLSASREADARRISDSIDLNTLDRHDPDLQIRALKLIARDLEKSKDRPEIRKAVVARWLDTAERLYGSDSPETARAYVWTVGVIDDPVQQENLMQKAYRIQTAKLPPVSFALARAELNMGAYYIELRERMDLGEPHLARAVDIGRRASSRKHSDVRKFERRWAKVLNALGRHRQCLEKLSAPPGEPEDQDDAKALSELHLELAKAAIAEGRPAMARAEVTAIQSLWPHQGVPIPASLSTELAPLTAKIGQPTNGDPVHR
jgi:eukaryotic-like serine/threonine-protein kinase